MNTQLPIQNPLRLTNPKFILVFIVCWYLLLAFAPLSVGGMIEHVLFALLGVLGAIFANATGAGGGVVFIPMFNQLAFSEQQAIATSFAIQCFGMSAGAYTWYFHYASQAKQAPVKLKLWQNVKRISLITGLASVAGLWWVYATGQRSPSSLNISFSWFSLVLGLAIIVTVWRMRATPSQGELKAYDYIAFVLIGVFGGAITAWMSVGVGELLAIYLILRRFEVSMAVAVAVIVSALTVWAGIWQHTLVDFQVYWQVVIFAGPGAVIGGMLAKILVARLSPVKLKLFFALWLLLIGLVGIV